MNRLLLPALMLAAVVAASGVHGGILRSAHAQIPPARFFGTLAIDGQPAPVGTELRGFIGEVECGFSTTTDEGRYVLDVKSDGTATDCGRDEAEVRIVVGNAQADQVGAFQTGHFILLNLTVGGGSPIPLEPPAAQPLPTTEETGEQPPAEQPPSEEQPPAEPPPPTEEPPAEAAPVE